MAAWDIRQLGEIAEVTTGNPAPQDPEAFSSDGIPFVRMQDVGAVHTTRSLETTVDRVTEKAVTKHRLRRFRAGSLLIPKSGASVNLNHRALLGIDAYVVSHLAVVIPNQNQVLPDFLYYWSLTYDPRHQAQVTSLPSLPTSQIKATSVPVPPLSEQRRIMDILSRAEGIVRLRWQATKLADEMIPSLFAEMFGDPEINPKRWSQRTLGEVVEEFRYGTSVKSAANGYPALRIPNVIGGMLDFGEIKRVPAEPRELEKLRLRQGDLLFVRTNGNPDYVGRCAMFDEESAAAAGYASEPMIFASYLIRARLRSGAVRPEYLKTFLATAWARKQIRERARTSAGQYNINTENLGTVTVLGPSLARQEEFERWCESVRSIIGQAGGAVKKAEELFQSLLHCAFCGEL